MACLALHIKMRKLVLSKLMKRYLLCRVHLVFWVYSSSQAVLVWLAYLRECEELLEKCLPSRKKTFANTLDANNDTYFATLGK